MAQVIERSRLTDPDGVEITLPVIIKIIKMMIKNKNLLESDSFPLQINNAMREFYLKDDEKILAVDVENLMALFRYYNFTFDIVGRLDLNESEVQLDEDVDQFSYLMDNFRFNNTGTSAFYAGWSINYDFDSNPLVMDYLNRLGVDDSVKSNFELTTSFNTYELFKNSNKLDEFDDTLPMEYVRSRHMRYVIYRNI